jgi:hypothetical protein
MKEEEKKHEHEESVLATEAAPETETKKKMCLPCGISTKKSILIAVLIIIAALAFYFRGFFVAATVNGSPIGRFGVMREAEKQSGKSILDGIIIKKLIKSEAAKQKIVITKEDIAAEIAKLEEQLKSQNLTLDQALAKQGVTKASLEEQIVLQKQVEKMVPKIAITDAEIAEYIKTNKITIPQGEETNFRTQIKTSMEQAAFNESAQKFVEDLKAKASIKYMVTYQSF